jgi:uncharacterized membrane protein YeaQ/YmgE (transglycosylase-associated protein family)
MALILLIVIGAVIGWLGSIVMRTEESRGILHDIGIGIGGSLAIGLLASNFTILGGLRTTSVLASVAGAAIAVAGAYYYRKRKSQE